MKKPVFSGSCTALITPFCEDGSIDYDRLRALIELQIAAGIAALCLCGTTGESATLSVEEHETLISFAIGVIAGRCRVIAGTGSNDTKTALQLSLHAAMRGADALLLVTPYYNKSSQRGLIRHYSYVADRVNCPLILYNVPSRTGVSFTAETYGILSQHPNINGIKEASGNFTLIADTLAVCGDEMNLWSGNDEHVVAMMALGAKGVISVLGNLLPSALVEMTKAALAGDFVEAARLQIKNAPLISALFSEVNPIPLKSAMQAAGLDSGYLRLPLCELDVATHDRLLKEMKNAGILV